MHKTHANRTAFSSHLRGDGMRLTEHVTPIATTNWHNVQLSSDESTTDGSRHFFGALDTETDMSVLVPNKHIRLEASALTCSGLLLNWLDLHHIILQDGISLRQGRKEVIDDLGLLNREGEKKDFLQRLDLSRLYQTAKLGNRNPVRLLSVTSTSTSTSTTSSTSTATAASSEGSAETTTESSGLTSTRGCLRVGHVELFK